jgi:serine/threonine protein phosphatase PrpC
MLDSKTISHQGLVREANEDSFAEDLIQGFWIVADGVGGNGHGDVASQMAVQTIERRLRHGARLIEAIVDANEVVTKAASDNPSLTGMATTVVACRFEAGHYEVSWVGDSRAYLINAEGIMQLSADHNLANDLYQRGEIGAEECEAHSGQHELTQALGQMNLDKIPKTIGELHDGDCLLLCTDGLSGVLNIEEISTLAHGRETLDRISEKLLDRVLEQGAPDNVTFSLIRYREDDTQIEAADFSKPSYRLPFDRKPYEKNAQKRPALLLIILLSLVFLFFGL